MHFSTRLKYGLSILAISAFAQPALAIGDWQINPLGSGASGAATVSTLSTGGVGFIQILPDGPLSTTFSFIEHGAYQAYAPGSSLPFDGREITVAYSVSGTGSFADPGAMRMSAGQIDVYSDAGNDFGTLAPNFGTDNGTRIASFSLDNGYVANSTGQVIVNATGIAGSFAQGYLFNASGADLATLPGATLQLTLFNQPVVPDAAIISGVVCGLAQACANGIPTLSQLAFTVQDTGAVSISAVPEPEALAMWLAGLGLIGAVARRRQR